MSHNSSINQLEILKRKIRIWTRNILFLTKKERETLLIIGDLSRGGIYEKGIPELSKRLGLAEDSSYNRLRNLENRGLITRIERMTEGNKRLTSYYRINYDESLERFHSKEK